MSLPAGRFDDLTNGRTLGPLKQRDDLGLFRAPPDGDGFRGIGRLGRRRGSGLVLRGLGTVLATTGSIPMASSPASVATSVVP